MAIDSKDRSFIHLLRAFGRVSPIDCVQAGRLVLCVLFALMIPFGFSDALADSKLTYHGRITHHDGSPVTGKVDFKIQIWDSSEQCLLYEEVQTLNDIQNGIFALRIGENASALSPSNTIEKVFQSGGALTGAGGCTPVQGRKLALSFWVEGGADWETVPPTSISAVPQAIESKSVAGFGPENLLRVEEGGVAKPAPKFTQSEADELLLLARGQSTRYMRIENSVVTLPSYTSDPLSPPPAGSVWFEGSEIKFSDGAQVISLNSNGGGGGVTSVTSGDSFIQVNNTDPANPKISLDTAQVATQLSGSFASANDPRFDEAVKNEGGIVSIQAGNEADRPTAGTEGRLYVALDTQKIYRDNGSSWAVVAAVNSGGGGGTVSEVTVSGGPLSVINSTTTPQISIAQAGPSSSGYLSQADWNKFDSKLGSELSSGQIFVGDSSDVAIARTPIGDVGMDNTGTFTVTGLQGSSVSGTTPMDGQVLKFVGGGTNSWVPSNFSVGDLKTAGGVQQFAQASCQAHQTLTWNSLTDTFTCTNIGNLNASAITAGTLDIARIPTGTTAATVAVGDDPRFPSSHCGAGNKMRWDGNAWVCEPDDDSAASATSANNANTIVKRDASGNFSAGTITANLVGNVTGNVSGTASNVTGIVDVAHGGTGLD